MTDVKRLPPHLVEFFEPPKALRYLAPVDHTPEHRSTPEVSSTAEILSYVRESNLTNDNYTPTESWFQIQKRATLLKKKAHEENLKLAIQNWNPKDDAHIRGDPFKTVFISRLSYQVTEEDLERECAKYGPIERVRLVNDKEQKSRGYAFVVYSSERDARIALKELDGLILKGRKILADVERGRSVRDWKPRRLGGGKGGRGYTASKSLNSYKSRLEGNDRDRDRNGNGGYGAGPPRSGPPYRDRDSNRPHSEKPYSRPKYDSRPRYDRGDRREERYDSRRDFRPRDRERERRDNSPSRTAGRYY